MAKCRLCLKEKKLIKKSHIIPDFMYAQLYDEKHKFILTSNHEITKTDGKKSYRPTGEYEGGLLCENCDNVLLGKYESYASKTLYGREMPIEQAPIVTNHFNEQGTKFSHVKNIDYKNFKLFLLSVLWRASLSTRQFFNEINIGRHEERIRQMLYNDDPGDELDYPVQLLTYVNDKKMPQDLIAQPRTFKYEGQTQITFLIGGIFYGYIVSSHAKPASFATTTIKKTNELIMLHIPEGKGWDFVSKFGNIKK